MLHNEKHTEGMVGTYVWCKRLGMCSIGSDEKRSQSDDILGIEHFIIVFFMETRA